MGLKAASVLRADPEVNEQCGIVRSHNVLANRRSRLLDDVERRPEVGDAWPRLPCRGGLRAAQSAPARVDVTGTRRVTARAFAHGHRGMSRDTFVHTNSVIQAAKQHSQRTRGKAVLAFGLLANGTVYRWQRIHLPRACPASHFERWMWSCSSSGETALPITEQEQHLPRITCVGRRVVRPPTG